MLIEAKFGSLNGTMARKKDRFGSVAEFLNRYVPKEDCSDPLDREAISKLEDKKILEQLCRNVIFSQWLTTKSEQSFVINLVRRAAPDDENDFKKNHLSGDAIQFHRRTWEDLFALPVVQSEQGKTLKRYMSNKTLRLAPAFEIARELICALCVSLSRISGLRIHGS